MHCKHATHLRASTYRCALGLFGGSPHIGVCLASCWVLGDQREWTRVEGCDIIADAAGPTPTGYKPDPRNPLRFYKIPEPSSAQPNAPCKNCRGL